MDYTTFILIENEKAAGVAEIILNPGREKSLLRRHPWVFSGAIQQIEGSPAAGDTVEVLDARRNWLGRGGYSPHSQIAVRIYTWEAAQQVDKEFFRSRLQRAIDARQPLFERYGHPVQLNLGVMRAGDWPSTVPGAASKPPAITSPAALPAS